MIDIPQQLGMWQVSHNGELLGTLKGVQGVHFDEHGYVTPSPKSVALYSSATDANFGLPLQILYYNSKYFVLTDANIWEISTDLLFTDICATETGEPDVNGNSDAVIWQGKVYVTGDNATNVRLWDGSNWASSSGGLTIALTSDDYPHPMAVMGNFAGGSLCVGEANVVKRYSSNDDTTPNALRTTLTLNSDYIVTCLLYRQNYLYIGTRATNGGEAKVFVWNGSGVVANQEYGVGADAVFSICEYGDSFAIVTSAGQILRWNGGGFSTELPLANFPVFYTPYRWSNNLSSPKVAMRGMKADGDLLYININGAIARRERIDATDTTNGSFLVNQPSGVWCFDPKVGLYCRSLSTVDGYQSLTASNLSSNILTLSSAITASTGDPILVFENGDLTGIRDDTVYYIIKESTTTVKLAHTRADALAGTAITLGGAVTNATFRVLQYNQHGEIATVQGDVGGIGLFISDTSDPPIIPKIFDTLYMWGFSDRSNATYLNSQSASAGIGSFQTARIVSTSVTETWQKAITKHSEFFMDTDKIVVRAKVKTRQDFPTRLIYGTYSSETAIGTSDSAIDRAVVGDSVHIIGGDGGGQIRTITAISGDELTLNEAVANATPASAVLFYIDSFKTKHTATTDSSTVSEGYIETGLDAEASPYLQLHFEVRGMIKIPQIQIVNTPHKLTA